MSSQLLWYTTRGAGAVSLVLLSAVAVLGLLARLRFEASGWPRFLSAAVHGDLALMTLVFLVLHIVTAVVDPFTHLGLAALVPFGSYYRTLWLGLGAIAFDCSSPLSRPACCASTSAPGSRARSTGSHM